MSVDLTRRTAGGLLLAGLASPALARPAAPQGASAAFEADRKAILAMAGNFDVRFDFRETVAFQPDYKPIDRKLSGGDEAVRVILDEGDRISLQHLLVVDTGEDKFVVKHWRQDWAFEPREVLSYEGPDTWVLREVPANERRGVWSQTVWQTDDSPRYGGIGPWRHETGVSSWTSDRSARPLARRDAIRKPPYDRYLGINRHALTPTGWVHEQDNAKAGPRDGALVTFVHEVVLNTYDRSTDFDAAFADRYWAATSGYWAAVRQAWDERIRASGGVRVAEEADNGSITGPRLMDLADQIFEGKVGAEEAIGQARRVIAENTGAPRLA